MNKNMHTSHVGDNIGGSTTNLGRILTGNNAHIGNNNFSFGENKADLYEKCLKRLLRTLPSDPTNYRNHLLTLNGRWIKGTCDWVINTDAYSRWRGGTSELLWITGDPGKGKTMLSLYLISHCQTAIRQDPERRKLIYFLCGPQDGRNTGIAIMRALIYQLVDEDKDQKLFKHLKAPFARYGKELFNDGRFEELWKIFESIVRDNDLESVTCILDGLDECIEDSLVSFWVKIRELFSDRELTDVNYSPSCLKLIITSRNYPQSFNDFLHSFSRLRLEDYKQEVNRDVEKYVDARMDELNCSKRKKPKLELLRSRIKDKLLERANGTYLWVKFAVNALKTEECPDLEKAVSKFPHGLDGVYTRMLLDIRERFGREKRQVVVNILRWVSVAVRPLTLTELGIALHLKPAVGQELEDAVDDYVRYAGDLLTVYENCHSDNIVQRHVLPVHASVIDFLFSISKTDEELRDFRLSHRKCHKDLAKRTLDYSLEILSQNPHLEVPALAKGVISKDPSHDVYRKFPLLQYSLFSGLQHTFRSGKRFSPSMTKHKLFNPNTPEHCSWICAQSLAVASFCCGPTTRNVSLIHLAALLGNIDLLNHCIKTDKRCTTSGKSHQVDIYDTDGRTPLFYAVVREQEMIVEYLIQKGANVNQRDVLDQTPLHLACAYSNDVIVQMLLKRGADINRQCHRQSSYTWAKNTTTRSDIAFNGIPASLIDHDWIKDENESYVVNKEHAIGSPLHCAAEHGRVSNVKSLLKAGTSVDALDDNAKADLHRAVVASGGNDELYKTLLQSGANAILTDDSGYAAIHNVASECEDGLLNFLPLFLDNGVPVELPTVQAENSSGGVTALRIASNVGTVKAVKYLAERGTNINHTDDNGRTALHWFCSRHCRLGANLSRVCAWLLSKMSVVSIYAKDRRRNSV